MTAIPYRPLVFASVLLLALPACAATLPTPTATEAAAPAAVDLGPSSRVPRTRMAIAGAGHEDRRTSMSSAPSGKAQLVGDAHATGTVNAVDPAQHKINLSHGAISVLGWPAMTMEFPVAPSVDLTRIKPGSRVDFTLEKKGADGMYEVQSVQPAGGGR
jgi:Cu(I)/Ag(I) efflux system protein CusF